DWVSLLSQHHRIQGSPMYDEAAQLVFEELEKLELDEVKLCNYPADGSSATWEWFPPYSWDISAGELWLVEPEREPMCRFDELPMSVVTHSESCDVIAEIIDAGKGENVEDYQGKDVSGKIAMISGSVRKSHDLAVDAGAIGLLIYPDDKRAAGYPTMVRYDGIWPTKENRDKTTFGFSLSNKQAKHLQELMEKGPVKVHAKIDARLFDGQLTVISAAIKGTELPEEEIILTAHLCHPSASANDNASGAAGLLEVARTLERLIERGALQPPKRTIRFLWVPEFHGTVAWLKENKERMKHSVACINLDMIGEDPVKIGYPFQVSNAAYSTPSILNDVIHFFVREIADHPKGIAINGTTMPMRYRFGPFAGGSDHLLFSDAHFGIPGVMFGHKDTFHHTSLDTTDVCDPTEMQRVIGIASCTSYLLNMLDGDSLWNYRGIINPGMYRRLGKTVEMLGILSSKLAKSRGSQKENHEEGLKNGELVITTDEHASFGLVLIEAAVMQEKQMLASLKKFGEPSTLAEQLMEEVNRELDHWMELEKAIWVTNCHSMVSEKFDLEFSADFYEKRYGRKFDGPVTYKIYSDFEKEKAIKRLLERLPKWNYGGMMFEILNLVGLDLDIKTISSVITLQYGCMVYPSEIHEFLEFLVRKGILDMVE
ncbi:MAG: DUF4910 domain-containing protein, partial [Candidatus Odinarchaeota archaeon]